MLLQSFRPEFINRIDAIVFFKKLTQEDVQKIAAIQLQHLINRLLEKHITLSIDDKALAHLAAEGYSPEFGARPLKRVIQQHVLVPISQHILKHPETKNISLIFKDGHIALA